MYRGGVTLFDTSPNKADYMQASATSGFGLGTRIGNMLCTVSFSSVYETIEALHYVLGSHASLEHCFDRLRPNEEVVPPWLTATVRFKGWLVHEARIPGSAMRPRPFWPQGPRFEEAQ